MIKSFINVLLLGLIAYGGFLFVNKFIRETDIMELFYGEKDYTYPSDINIVRDDGTTLKVSLLARNSSYIQIERKKDGKIFVYPISSLAEKTRLQVAKYPENGIDDLSKYTDGNVVHLEDLYINQLESEVREIEKKIRRLGGEFSTTNSSTERRTIENEMEELKMKISEIRAQIAERQ